jgi:NitT/TauT family transport system substrate-binding protein
MHTLSLQRRSWITLLGSTLAAGLMLAQPAQAQTKLNVGVLRLTSHAPVYIAFEKGYFKQAGFDVELKYFQASAAMAVAVAGKDVDYGTTSITGGLVNLAEKGAVKVIGGALAEQPGVPGAVILASNQAFAAGLTSPTKLAGKTFGTTTAGSSFHYMLSRIAAGEKLEMSSITMKPLQKMGALVGAISSGQIDAWVIQPSVASKLLAEGKAKKIGDFSRYDPNYQVTATFTSAERASKQREQTQAFMTALAKGVADYNAAFVDKTASAEQTTALIKLVHKYVNVDAPEATLAKSLKEGSMRINQGLALSLDSIKAQLQWMQAEKMVSDKVTIDMLVDTSYVKTL